MIGGILKSTASGVSGTKLKIGKIEYTLIEAFSDGGETFYVAKYYSLAKYVKYRIIGWNKVQQKHYIHS